MNTRSGRKERIGRLLEMNSAAKQDLDIAYAGDIVAFLGLKDMRTGDTLTDETEQIVLENLTFPEPVVDVVDRAKLESRPGQAGQRSGHAVG